MFMILKGLNEERDEDASSVLRVSGIDSEIQYPYASKIGYLQFDFAALLTGAELWFIIDELTKLGLAVTFQEYQQ